MKFVPENGCWYVETDGKKTLIEDFIATLMNKNLLSPTYVVGKEMDDPNLYTPLTFYDDPRYPNGALKSPFQMHIYLNDDGSVTIRLQDISNIAIANELKTSLAELGFKNVLFSSSKETIEKIAKFFGD